MAGTEVVVWPAIFVLLRRERVDGCGCGDFLSYGMTKPACFVLVKVFFAGLCLKSLEKKPFFDWWVAPSLESDEDGPVGGAIL
jgi:hypothetical protein